MGRGVRPGSVGVSKACPVPVALAEARGVSVYGVKEISTFGVIGMTVTENGSVASGIALVVGVGLPALPGRAGLRLAGLFNNHHNPKPPRIRTTTPSNISKSRRFLIGVPNNRMFAELPITSGGKGASSLRVKTGQSVCCRALRQTRR